MNLTLLVQRALSRPPAASPSLQERTVTIEPTEKSLFDLFIRSIPIIGNLIAYCQDRLAQKALWEACRQQDAMTVQTIVSRYYNRPSFFRFQLNGETPLTAAIASYDPASAQPPANLIAVISALLSSSCSPDPQDRLEKQKNAKSYSPLALALQKRCPLPVIQKLVKEGADVDEADPAQFTPLMQACEQENRELRDYLLYQGADPDARGQGASYSARQYAQYTGRGAFFDSL
jgi:hypothetical protein